MGKKSLLASRISPTNSLNAAEVTIEPVKKEIPKNTAPIVPQQKKEKKKLFEKRKKAIYKTDGAVKPVTAFDHDSFEAEMEREYVSKTNHEESQKVVKRHLAVGVQIGIVALCIYICFLIYGLISTNYAYDDGGNVSPVVLSVSDLKVLNEYESIVSYYLRARIVYEQTLTLDYELSQRPEDALLIAMEYTALLDTVDKLAVDLRAAEYSTRYTALYSQVNRWTTTYIAVYLQKMAIAITENNSVAANDAVIARDIVYTDFAQITANIATIASNTKGVQNINLYTWTPEVFIENLREGEN